MLLCFAATDDTALMGSRLVVELFVERQTCSRAAIHRTIDVLLAAGFHIESSPGHGVQCWNAGHFLAKTSLEGALDEYNVATDWGLTLWKTPLDPEGHAEQIDVLFSVARGHEHNDLELGRISLSLGFTPSDTFEPTLKQEFVAWAGLLAELTDPRYGWGGLQDGLFSCETRPVSESAIAELIPQPLEWLNFFGPGYVERLGLKRLLSAPVMRAEIRANGSVMLQLSPHPLSVTRELAINVAEHLAIPLVLPTVGG